MHHMAGARRSPPSANRDVTGKEGKLKVYNEAELGVQRLRIPGELKDGGEAIHCTTYVLYAMPVAGKVPGLRTPYT